MTTHEGALSTATRLRGGRNRGVLRNLEAVTRLVQQCDEHGVTVDEIGRLLGMRETYAALAVRALREEGAIRSRGRRYYPVVFAEVGVLRVAERRAQVRFRRLRDAAGVSFDDESGWLGDGGDAKV